MRRRLFSWAGLAVIVLLLAGVAWAQVSPNFDLSWHVMGGGGRDMASANHAHRGTLGQFAIGPAESASYGIESGYWHGIRPAGPIAHQLYLPLVHRNYVP